MKSKSFEKEGGPEGLSILAKEVLERAKNLSKEERLKLTHLLIDLSVKLE
ncbi:hypothetical protein N836_31695 [Leptolyngbya sp. Heron Island J]|nr:hypothetical protein [Leptolyngbya sp. Heron Island J]ESA38506.1 hypothetical protein N836_31695 [Leptolyngbya sp. Heron Island J]